MLKEKIPIMFIPQTEQIGKRTVFCEKEYALYIHLPFCKQKCHFCSIRSVKYCNYYKMEMYVKTIIHELYKHEKILKSSKIVGVHIGGGTPSLLSTTQIERIISTLKKYMGNDMVEIVFEANPESLSIDKIKLLADYPKLTLNIGIQTFDRKQLKAINRMDDIKRIIDCLSYIQEKGFWGVGIDLIAGLPYSTTETVLRDLSIADELGIKNVFIYPIRIEENSYIYNHSDLFTYLHKDELIGCMEDINVQMRKRGFLADTIFRWTKDKKDLYRYANHQMNGGEWLGIGAGAYSYINGSVYLNDISVLNYKKMIEQSEICYYSVENKTLTSRLIWEFSFMLRKGYLDAEYINQKYGGIVRPYLNSLFKHMRKKGYAYNVDKKIFLSTKGKIYLEEVEKIIEEVIGGG